MGSGAQQILEHVLQAAGRGFFVGTGEHLCHILSPGFAGARLVALGQQLQFRNMANNPPLQPVEADKGSTLIRGRLSRMLQTSLYELDRVDARVDTTLHVDLQDTVSHFLAQLNQPAFVRTHNLVGDRMLNADRLKEVQYSFTLLERTAEGNKVRVQTDPTRQALDINEGSKLELGSTA